MGEVILVKRLLGRPYVAISPRARRQPDAGRSARPSDSEGCGQVVSMPHLIQATRREYQKMGKVVTEREFGEYAGHVKQAQTGDQMDE